MQSMAERVDQDIGQSEVGWATRLAGQPVAHPNPKKPTSLRGAAGVWNRESGDRTRDCDGARIHVVDSLTGVSG
jgi:hypothetical protein